MQMFWGKKTLSQLSFCPLGLVATEREVEFYVSVYCNICLVYFCGSITDNFPNYG